jgi:hypothetical protein
VCHSLQRKIEIESIVEEYVNVKSHDRNERDVIAGWAEGMSIVLLEGSQASTTRPSDKGSMKLKTLSLLQIGA